VSNPETVLRVAVIGAGVSGLTCGLFFADRGFPVTIFADQIGRQTTSGAAGALWFPYDAQPAARVIPWALATFKVLVELSKDARSGVSMIELRQYCRSGEIEIPEWVTLISGENANPARAGKCPNIPGVFSDGFSLRVPLTDTTIYLDYLINCFQKAGGAIRDSVRVEKFEEIDMSFNLVINCAGIGARELAEDTDLEPHRGQTAIVPRFENLNCALVCDDDPLTYVIPRTNDCVFGGTNDLSENLEPDPQTTEAIVAECSRVLQIKKPAVLRQRVGLRPFRKSGVRVEKCKLRDGRTLLHNYGHGGSGFTLSWGCARNVFDLANPSGSETGRQPPERSQGKV